MKLFPNWPAWLKGITGSGRRKGLGPMAPAWPSGVPVAAAGPVPILSEPTTTLAAATSASIAEVATAPPSTDAETVLILIDVAPSARAWGLQRYVLGSWPLRNVEGLQLVKVLGSGHDGGFGLRPSGTRQGLLCLFDTSDQAVAFLRDSAVVAEYRANAREFFSIRLRAYSCRGSWSGVSIPVVEPTPELLSDAPIATLTRASIRPRSATQFWKMAPATQSGLEQAEGCRLAVGLGEAPLLRQATFSLWTNASAMDHYARAGAHLAAIQAAHQHDFFSESMFVRFVPKDAQGLWKGRRYPQALQAQAGEPPLFAKPDPMMEVHDAVA